MLLLGDQAITIISGNLRVSPNGQIVRVLPAFTPLVITSGPVVQGGLTWWQVRNGESGWLAEMARNYTIILRRYDGSDFGRSLNFVLNQEGGEADVPGDSGGYTRWGIAQNYNRNVDVRTLTPERMEQIYREKYWEGYGCNKYTWPLCCCVFDVVVNMGPGGLHTLLRENHETAKSFNEGRRNWYRNAVQFAEFGGAWLDRVDALNKYIDT